MSRSIEEALRVLGVAADSDPATVAHAYRRLARATHPDVSPDPDATHRFATVAAAYRLVADRARRAAHGGLDRGTGTGTTLPPIDLPGHGRQVRPWLVTIIPDQTPVQMVAGASPYTPAHAQVQAPILAGPVRLIGESRPDRAPDQPGNGDV